MPNKNRNHRLISTTIDSYRDLIQLLCDLVAHGALVGVGAGHLFGELGPPAGSAWQPPQPGLAASSRTARSGPTASQIMAARTADPAGAARRPSACPGLLAAAQRPAATGPPPHVRPATFPRSGASSPYPPPNRPGDPKSPALDARMASPPAAAQPEAFAAGGAKSLISALTGSSASAALEATFLNRLLPQPKQLGARRHRTVGAGWQDVV
jgi:hypothetical protein